MSADMSRNPGAMKILVADAVEDSQSIPFHDFAAGFIHVPATEGASFTLSFYASTEDDPDGDFQLAHAYEGTQITVTVGGGKTYELHPSLSSALWIRIVASAVSVDPVPYKFTAKS